MVFDKGFVLFERVFTGLVILACCDRCRWCLLVGQCSTESTQGYSFRCGVAMGPSGRLPRPKTWQVGQLLVKF